MLLRCVRLVVLAVPLLAGVGRGQHQQPAEGSDPVQEVERLGNDLGGKSITAGQLERLEKILDGLPAAGERRLVTALNRLCDRLPQKPESGGAARFVAVYDRLAAHPSIGREESARLRWTLGNHEFDNNRFDEALAQFALAASHAPLAFYASLRACRCETERQHYRAAYEHLAKARMVATDALKKMQLEQMEALVALRVGLFDKAGEAIARARKLADGLQQAGQLTNRDAEPLLLLEMDEAVFHQDLERAIAKAEAVVSATQGAKTRERAKLVLHAARVRLGGRPELDELQAMFANAELTNREAIGALSIEQAFVSGRSDLAASIAKELLANRQLRDLSPAALVAIGMIELQPATMPSPGSDRWREWDDALHDMWARFLAEWRALAPEAEGVAFLQMGLRRSVLNLAIRMRHAAGVETAAAHAATLYLEAEALGSTARRLGIGSATIGDAVRELVPARGALLVYVPAPVGSIALWFTPTESHVELLPPEGLLRRRVFDLHRLTFSRERAASADEVRAAAESVAEGLLTQELRDRLAAAETLLIAGTELIHDLRLQLLPARGASRWLGLEKPICSLPSITIALHLGRRPAAGVPELDARVIAATELRAADSEQWHREAIAVEASDLAAAVAAVDPARTEIKAPASADELTHPRIRSELLAVFAHGIHDARLACAAGLLLGPDRGGGTGAVFAPAIASAGQPRCLFLGVCGASSGALRLGEDGGTRLPGVFLTAGCDLVVSSDSDLRLDEALAMLGGFTSALAAGDSPAVALWRARRKVASATPHPGAWAGLQLEGLPTARVRLTPAVARSTVWVWLTGAVLLGGCTWLGRRRYAAARPR
ncbi:MAG TPA: CHAT domain-containing protein [Planctomycetota bacterium]